MSRRSYAEANVGCSIGLEAGKSSTGSIRMAVPGPTPALGTVVRSGVQVLKGFSLEV